MADREKILRFFKSGGDEEFAGKMLDLADAARRSRRFKISGFMDPHEQNVAEIVAANFPQIRLERNGGFLNAERMRVAFICDDFYGQPDFAIAALQVLWDKRYYDLGHRDVLGAFMGMGCTRDVLGDIVFNSDGCQMVVDKPMVQYVLSNLTKIGAAVVEVKEIGLDELKEKEQRVKIISATVSALRLDAVAAAGYGVSRSRMADEIKGLNVRVNWQDAKSPSMPVKEGDIISFRSRGRVELAEVRGTTKKGRIGITLKRYI
ncbi:MAG: YlmH/Sll1252 family protein [Acidaminococcus sp.]|jgi:RNA-binding protein YlmH|nr:YlmH/Sll1252 family protein [Acidaminococcus sp.]MCI2115980.1 YlmH/Sll1252 family protein [Acidaminococcus sp.]